MRNAQSKTKRVMVRRVRGALASCLLVSATVLGLLATNNAVAQTCTPPPPDMVSWWPGDGNANDIQGSNNGTLEGSTTFASGKIGQAFSFNGVDGGGGVNLSISRRPAASRWKFGLIILALRLFRTRAR